MSDEFDDETGEPDESPKMLEARRKIAEACAIYADAYETTAGRLVTGYVCIFELSDLDNHRGLYWMTGTGEEPTAKRAEGLASWRVEGMVRHAIRDIIVDNVTR